MSERELLMQCYPLVVHAANLAPDMYTNLKERIYAALSAPAPAKQEQAEAQQEETNRKVMRVYRAAMRVNKRLDDDNHGEFPCGFRCPFCQLIKAAQSGKEGK